ncbi:MAG: type II secretion system F family protein [Thermoguttaceae bacterium]
MQYAYTARSKSGEPATGVLAADSPAQAHRQLRQQGLFVISVSEAGRGAGRTAGGISRRRRVSCKDLLAFTSQLAIMSKAGIDVAGALHTLQRQCPSPTLKAALESVYQDVVGGKAFSAALHNHAEVFGSAYVASVAAGEASGRLPEVLSRLAATQRKQLRLRSARRALLAYPIVLCLVAGLVVIGLMLFVLPQFAGVFAQFDMNLPAITYWLLALSEELQRRSWLWLALVVLAGAALVGLRSHPAGQRLLDRFLLNAALVRGVVRPLLTGRTFGLLGIMIESGVPLVEGLRLTRFSVRNSVFRGLFEKLEQDVTNGRGLSEALAAAPFIPSGAAEMIATAERTGSLGSVAQVIGEYYEEEAETRLRELTTLIEPLIIVAMGLVVACIVLAVMLPMFDFATLAQHAN